MLSKYPSLQKLPRRKQAELAEELWISAMDDRDAPTADQKRILDERMAAYRSGKDKGLSRAELMRLIRR